MQRSERNVWGEDDSSDPLVVRDSCFCWAMHIKIQGYFEFVVFLFVFIAKLEEEKKKLLTADTRVRRGEDYVLPIGYSWINPSSQLFLLCYR